VAETILANSVATVTNRPFAYAVAWDASIQTARRPSVFAFARCSSCCWESIGRAPAPGVMALRGHASIQGSTDIPTLLPTRPRLHEPSIRVEAPRGRSATGSFARPTTLVADMATRPSFMVSYLKSMYGAAATKDNDFATTGTPDHRRPFHLPMVRAMSEGV